MRRLIFALIALALLLIYPETALNAVQGAARAWAESVAPAMFPYLLLLPLLTCRESMRAYERLLGRPLRALFHLPGSAAPAIVIGMLAGSPAGAIAAARSGLDQKTRERIVCCVCGPGAGFLVSGIGGAMLGDASKGAILLAAQLISQTAMLLATRGRSVSRESTTFPELEISNGAADAVKTLLIVLGNMAMYALIAAILSQIIRRPAIGTGILCALDLPSGARALAAAKLSERTRIMLLAAVCGWSGLCIIGQNLQACPVRRERMLAARFAHAIIMAAAAAGMLKWRANVAEGKNALAISALAAAILAVPALFGLVAALFLNKPTADEKRGKKRQKRLKTTT